MDEEIAALEREFEAARAGGGAADAIVASRERSARERAKGQAVKTQRTLWERMLELRILLQGCLQVGRTTPRQSTRNNNVCCIVDVGFATVAAMVSARPRTDDFKNLGVMYGVGRHLTGWCGRTCTRRPAPRRRSCAQGCAASPTAQPPPSTRCWISAMLCLTASPTAQPPAQKQRQPRL